MPLYHRLAKNKHWTPEQLFRTPLIIRKIARGRTITHNAIETIRKKGIAVNIALPCESSDAVKEAVRNQMGMGILSRANVENEIRKGEFQAIKLPGTEWAFKRFICYLKNKPLSKAAGDSLQLLRDAK